MRYLNRNNDWSFVVVNYLNILCIHKEAFKMFRIIINLIILSYKNYFKLFIIPRTYSYRSAISRYWLKCFQETLIPPTVLLIKYNNKKRYCNSIIKNKYHKIYLNIKLAWPIFAKNIVFHIMQYHFRIQI